jgi:cytochrome c
MRSLGVVLFVAIFFAASAGHAVDKRAAKGLAKDSDCFKCHSVSKEKDGPPYKKIAKKYKGNANAEAIITKHITTSPTVKVDGKEETHKAIKTTDAAEIKNLVQWILSR